MYIDFGALVLMSAKIKMLAHTRPQGFEIWWEVFNLPFKAFFSAPQYNFHTYLQDQHTADATTHHQ
jgi:hypothetical protein